MDNVIDINRPVFEIIQAQPEILPLLVDLGFTPLQEAALLHTLGRLTSLKKGADMLGIPIEKVSRTLRWNGYEVEE